MNKRVQRYRAASWWITWDDLSYPDLGVQKKVQEKAAKFHEAGIDLAIIFGIHFRWDFIYMWDRAHDLLRLIADELHKYDIKLFDHHSANLTCRPRDFDNRWDNFYRNKHHIPFYPSKSIVNELSFNSSKLNDFRMIDVVTGEACYLPQYSAEIYCMNNPEFRIAYEKYLEMLLTETGIDGLMCDDIIHYPGWHSCACKYCKAKFKSYFNIDLPAANDVSFWGNYDSPAFRSWVEMRYNDSADFLNMVKNILPSEMPLLSCCSDSWPKHIDQYGCSLASIQHSVNHGMLEMCSEIVSEHNSYSDRIPNILLHNGMLSKNDYPSLGLGYGFCKDTAFLTWALNVLTGSSCWMSTLKGRLGLGKDDAATLPDEEDIVQEGYLFEKNNPQLFTGKSTTATALYFSFSSLKNSGDSTADYSATYQTVVSRLFESNLQFDVIDSLNQLNNYRFLLLHDTSCLADAEIALIDKFISGGGTLIATGITGIYTENGEKRSAPFLDNYGITATIEQSRREQLPLDKFFTPLEWPPKRQAKTITDISYQAQHIDTNQWIEVESGAGKLYWHSMHCQGQETINVLSKQLTNILPTAEFTIKLNGKWYWRTSRDNERYLIYVLSNEVTANEDPELRNQMTGRKLIRSLEYHTCSDKVTLTSSHKMVQAKIYSPDCDEVIEGDITGNKITFAKLKLVRFFIIEIYCQK
jgi:hypothetical protein